MGLLARLQVAGVRWPSSGGLAIFDFMQQFAV